MNIPTHQPALAYDINMLLSALSRIRGLKNDDLSSKEKIIAVISQEIVPLLQHEKPLALHHDPIALDHIKGQLLRMLGWLDEGFLSVLPAPLREDVMRLLHALLTRVQKAYKRPMPGLLYHPDTIGQMFGFDGMWDMAHAELEDEKDRIPQPLEHPDTPKVLTSLVSMPELSKLVLWSYQELFQVRSSFSAVLEIIDDPNTHHLLWSVDDQRIRFAVPNTFPIDVLFSFEIPHTPAHLLHLEALEQEGEGVEGYWDDMEQRSFFEAIAVLSEWEMIQALQHRPEISHSLIACLNARDQISPGDLRAWLLQDRLFEARLRAARLLADICTIEGMTYDQTLDKIQKDLGIPRSNAEREIQKYYSLTGLGAIYTLGYRRLLKAGRNTVSEALVDEDHRVIRTWRQFAERVELPEKRDLDSQVP